MQINFPLLIELVKRDFKEKYTGSVFGVWWAFIWPAVNIFIYTVIFSKVMSAKIEGIPSVYSYGLYLSAGIIPWMAFANTISRSANIFVEKKHIITKVPIQLPLLPLSIALSESITFLVGMFIFVFVSILVGVYPSKFTFLVLFAYSFQQLFAVGLGLFLATLNVFIRDIKEVVGIVLQIWFWFTPIVYVIDILPEIIKKLMSFNIAYAFIQVYQKAFITKQPIDLKAFLISSLISILVFVLSYIFYKKLSKDIRDFL